jgi:hypothetical protein
MPVCFQVCKARHGSKLVPLSMAEHVAATHSEVASLLGIARSRVLTTVIMGEPSVRRYSWATLFLGDITMGTWPSRLGESQMRQ